MIIQKKIISSIKVLASLILILLISVSCSKDDNFIPDNNPPDYSNISAVKIENYVNRLFIDLLGREPLNTEMAAETTFLKENDLSKDSRVELIQRLQSNTDWVEGDSSYFIAYHKRLYDIAKVRTIEGVADSDIQGSIGIASFSLLQAELLGDSARASGAKQTIKNLEKVLSSQYEYREGLISINEVFRRMINNRIFDEINMNTLNFINASFDLLLFRYPTQFEFDKSYSMIQHNESVFLMGSNGSNKSDYLDILVNNKEFYEGIIKWAYIQLVARQPESIELAQHMQYFYPDADFYLLQQNILKTDEYANF
ncbi:MAG: hypothetical protein EA412_02550 [Chitinophagaceae bacterium]|nr:MAG: hypothetical protein EA412_02550 [Chitinophagaceae bacterium]